MSHPVEVLGLVKRFGEVTALAGVDLTVKTGQVHGLLGPNGAGKSTLLRVLFGLVRPDDGSVRLFGTEHYVDGPATALVGVAGFVDRPHFYPYLSARRTLRLLAAADGLGAESTIDTVLARVGLSDAADRRVSGWSTGMVQRLGLACALVRRPRLLILDEPTEGLDPAGAHDLIGLVRSLTSEGVSVLFSSHDMAEVDVLCDEVTILHHGRVARTAPLGELRQIERTGRHRLVTSDNDAARIIGARHTLALEAHPRGGLSVNATPQTLHSFVCDLGRSDISVQQLEQDMSPLSALFYELTADRQPLGEPSR